MAGEDEMGRRSRQTVAVILVLCSLAQSLTCFSLSQKVEQDKVVGEATEMEVRTGSILSNGKELKSQSVSASAATTGNNGLLHMDSDQSYDTGMLEYGMTSEAAWGCLNPSLRCGQDKMVLKITGLQAADLQLDMANSRPLPLIQVPETCGYSVKQNALGLILVVPYGGCNVIQENGNYMLRMSWLETPVKLVCPMSTSSAKTPASLTPAPAPSAATATAKPDTTCMTTKPSTENPTQMKPPAYPYYPYYPYYPHYPLPNAPVMTTTPLVSTTKTPQKPHFPHYPPYFLYFPFYPPAGQPLLGMPHNTDVYYYPVIQHFYGKPPYPQNPPVSDSSPTTKPTTPSAPTRKACANKTKPSSSGIQAQ